MLVGKRINDRYEILQLIGGGGMSNVYLAHDIILNREVAIKILRYDTSNEEEYHRRFQREALSATSLTHSNIVSIYDVGEDGDMHYIVMEYVKGKTLKQYIQEFSPISPARSVQIMKQLTSAIAHAHENQIIHRDIKPQNILMDQNGTVKITDFGIATSLEATSYTKTNSVIGTVHYLSPEQARGGIATNKSDIYALGIVLYELLTGELPFSGESAVSIALKHLQAETPSIRANNASIPQALENVVLKATAKNPDHRYNSVEEMEADLETVLSESRLNEPKFVPPIDNDETKALPIFKDPLPVNEMANTRILTTEKNDTTTNKSNKSKARPVTSKDKKSNRKIWGIIGAIIAIIILLGILMFNLFKPEKLQIPDVYKMEVNEAIDTLEELGFVIGEQHEEHSEEVEEGLVIKTNPKAGLTRVEGTEIDLYVSLGNEKSVMEDYVGKQKNQVLSVLENSDFKDVIVNESFSNEPAGTVTAQSPKAGEEVDFKTTTVTITVSKGEEYKKVANLSGYNEAARDEYARSSGFEIKVTNEVHSDTIPAGGVVSQKPAANGDLIKGGTIEVTLSKGPADKNVKMYFKEVIIPYEPVQLGEQQQVRIFIQDKKNTMAEPFEEIYITDNYNYRIQLEIEEGQKAAYRIERDSIVIEEATIPYDNVN